MSDKRYTGGLGNWDQVEFFYEFDGLSNLKGRRAGFMPAE